MAQQFFNSLNPFKSVLEGFAVHKGNRGEFLALMLLTLARDEVVGPPDEDGCLQQQHRFFELAPFISGYLFTSTPKLEMISLRQRCISTISSNLTIANPLIRNPF